MNDQSDMNRGFLKEKLGDFRVDPPEKVWEEISGQLGRGRNRKGLYIFLLAAASVALALTLGLYFFGPDLNRQQSSREVIPVDVSPRQVGPGEDRTIAAPENEPQEPREQAGVLEIRQGRAKVREVEGAELVLSEAGKETEGEVPRVVPETVPETPSLAVADAGPETERVAGLRQQARSSLCPYRHVPLS